MTIRVGVIGALGKMGQQVCATIDADADLMLAAAIERTHSGESVGANIGRPEIQVTLSDKIDSLIEANLGVIVDFTHPDAVRADIDWAVQHGVHIVVGTTGLTDQDLEEIEANLQAAGNKSNVFIVPNFAIGAVLAEKFALQAVKYFPAVEVIELHHDQKADAPSGTAFQTAKKLRDAREEVYRAPDAESLEGVRGGDLDGVRVHSVRLPGFVAHEEIIFGGQGQSLTIRHDTTDRSAFMPGVVMAIKAIDTKSGLTVGLDSLLDVAD